MSAVNNSHALPAAMAGKLRRIRRRRVLLSALRAVAVGASTLVVAMLAAMAVDWWFTLFDPAVRTALTATALGVAAAALLAVGVPAAVDAWRWTRAAAGADREVPQLEERWTTVALLAQADDRSATPVAQAMREQVTREAVALERLVQPGRVARAAAVRPAALSLAACCVLLAGFLAVDWPRTSVLLRRFWSPRTAITATQLRSVTGDRVVPRGESLDLLTRLSGLPTDAATLELAAEADGAEVVDVVELRPDPERADVFSHRLRVDESFRYRVRAGDGRTPWHTVTAVEHPALGEVRLTVTPPDYVERPPYRKTLIPSRVKVVQGSRLELRMKPVAPLARLDLSLNFEPADGDGNGKPLRRRLTLAPDADGWYRFETQLLSDVSFSPTLHDRHGLTNEDRPLCRIQVVPDQAPVARILSPTGEMVVAPDNAVDVRFEAHDDHGIATAELVVYAEPDEGGGEEPRLLAVQPIPLDETRSRQHVRGSTRLELDDLGLEDGARISYAIRVTDNRHVTLDPDALPVQTAEARPGQPADEPTAGGPPRENAVDTAVALDPSDNAAPRDPSTAPRAATGTLPADAGAPTVATVATAEPGTESSPGRRPDGPAVAEKPQADLQADPQDAADAVAATNTAKPDASADPSGDSPSGDGSSRQAGPSGESTSSDPDAAREATDAVASGEDRNQPAPTTDAEKTDAGKTGQDKSVTPPSGRPLVMSPQQAESGQQAETNRLKLKIAQRLTAVATAPERQAETLAVRERVTRIDEMLSRAEAGLKKLVERAVPDAERSEQFRRLDARLGDVEAEIARLRNETKEHQYAFVGLQMADIGRSHVTPARDRTFVGIREPLGSDHASVALEQVVRARELLAALLSRYDRAARDRELARSLEDAVTMYEVYVEKTHQLMREARQTQNPLQRKMAVIEVDQDYLDRYAEVLTLRREMMAELARLLGDDPRLLARYLDLTKRRRTSLRDQLSELADRQDETAAEVLGWLEVGEAQRDVLWDVVADLRLQAATPLAKDAAALAEGVEKQMPLVLESDGGTSAMVIGHARQIARVARQAAFDAEKFLQPAEQPAAQPGRTVDLTASGEQLVHLCGELEAALDRLGFEHEDEEEVTGYVAGRLPEVRAVADQADAWVQVAGHLRDRRYRGLAEVDQHKLSVATELLRVEMLGIDGDLQGEFQQQAETDVPAEITDLVRQIHAAMEGVTFNQAAATFALTQDRLEAAAAQQAQALEGFEQAEKLFDRMRRAVVAALDEYDVPDPNVADLLDPTLDEFLARLEREPSIEAQLGIPNRPRNLRVIAETMEWQENGGELLGQSGEAAAARAREAMREQPLERPEKPDAELTDEEREQRAKAQEAQEELEKSLASVQAKADDPNTPPEQRRRLEELTENMERMLAQMGQRTADADEWERVAQSDKARGILRALARGERLPDDQWNKLLSTLDDGLWQVRGRKPPEDYRKAIEQYQEFLRQSENGDGEN